MKRMATMLIAVTAVATLGIGELTATVAGAVTGPTTTLALKGGTLHFTPKSMTVPDVGGSPCSSTNFSFQVLNESGKSVWLSLNGQETWFLPADISGPLSFCFSAPFANPLVFSVLNQKGKLIKTAHHLTLTVT